MPWTASGWLAHSRLRPRFAPNRGEGADDTLRKSQHEKENDDAEQGPPVLGLTHNRVLQRRKHRGPDDRPRQRLDAAEQHHDEAVYRPADVDRLRRYRAFCKGKEPARHTADGAGNS